MDESIQYAKKYLEDLLSFFGLNIEVEAINSGGEVIELKVPSTQLNGFLIGQNGETLHAFQSLVGSALKSNQNDITRVNIDVADYKLQRANRLAERALEWIESVKETGEAMHLKPMNAADRRIVHKLADEHGLLTESVGEGRARHVLLKPSVD